MARVVLTGSWWSVLLVVPANAPPRKAKASRATRPFSPGRYRNISNDTRPGIVAKLARYSGRGNCPAQRAEEESNP